MACSTDSRIGGSQNQQADSVRAEGPGLGIVLEGILGSQGRSVLLKCSCQYDLKAFIFHSTSLLCAR